MITITKERLLTITLYCQQKKRKNWHELRWHHWKLKR